MLTQQELYSHVDSGFTLMGDELPIGSVSKYIMISRKQTRTHSNVENLSEVAGRPSALCFGVFSFKAVVYPCLLGNPLRTTKVIFALKILKE